MPRNALLGFAVAAVTALGLTTGAFAAAVPLGDPLGSNAAWGDDPWAAATDEPDPFSDLLSVDGMDEGQAPLLELLGMPTQARRGKAAAAGGPVEPRAAAGDRETGRLAVTAALDDPDDGIASAGRRALEVFEALGVSSGPSDSYAMRHAAPSEPLPALPSVPSEGQSSWLREGLQLLRGNREWVVLAVAAVVLGMFAMRASSLWAGRPKPSGAGRALPRAPLPSRQGSR
jgi:hypothetical protein